MRLPHWFCCDWSRWDTIITSLPPELWQDRTCTVCGKKQTRYLRTI